MKILKTIVATAVVVFALTTVAMAGVQHFTKQSSQAAGTWAQAAQPTYTVTLTAAQLAELMSSRAAATGGVQHPREAQHHAKAARHHAEATRDHARSRDAGATLASASGSGGTHHNEAVHHTSPSGSGSGSHHAETVHHSGDCGDDGGDCGD